jgi:hypothetical protein
VHEREGESASERERILWKRPSGGAERWREWERLGERRVLRIPYVQARQNVRQATCGSKSAHGCRAGKKRTWA